MAAAVDLIRFIFFLTLFCWESSSTASSENPILSKLQNSGTWNLEQKFSNLIDVSQSKWKTVIDSLPEQIRNAILNPTRTGTITSADLRQLDPISISVFHDELNRVLVDNQVTEIIRGFLQKQQFRQAAQALETFAGRFPNNPDFFTSLWNEQSVAYPQQCGTDIQTFLRQGLRFLPPPEKWRLTLIKNLVSMLPALPFDVLIKIRDSEVAAAVLERWVTVAPETFGCPGQPSAELPEILTAKKIQMKLLVMAIGDESQWTVDVINRYSSLLPYASSRSLSMIDGRIVRDSLSQLGQIKNWKDEQGYTLIRQLTYSNSSGLSRINGQGLQTFMDRLGSMGVYLLPEYLMNATRTPPTTLLPIWADKIDSLSQQSGETAAFPRLTASALLQYKLSDVQNVSSLNAQNLSKMMDDINLAKSAPWNLWRAFLPSIERGNLQKYATDKAIMDLPLGLVKRLSEVAVKIFRNGDKWDINSTPVPFWRGANLSDWMGLQSREVQLDKIGAAAYKGLSDGALAILYVKFKEDRVEFFGSESIQAIKALANVKVLKTKPLDQLERFATDMPADSILRLVYAESKLEKVNITLDLLRTLPPLLMAHLTESLFESVPLNDTPALLATINSAPQSPSIQTIWALQERLKNFTKFRRPDVLENDASLLEHAWLSNFDIYSAKVLSGFSIEAIRAVSDDRKIELLRSLGRLPMTDYYTVPRSKRLFILEQGLVVLGNKVNDGALSEDDVAIIGMAVVDLSGQAIGRLTPRAFEYALPILQGDVEIFKGLSVRPCLNSDQRSGIRRSLKTIYGYPSSWDFGTVAALCCILDTLSEIELEAIRSDLLIDACLACKADTPPQLHLRFLSQKMQTVCLFELGKAEVENGFPLGHKLVVKRRALAAFSNYRNDKVFVQGINQQQQTSEQTLTCDAVFATGSGGSGFTVNQLKSMSNQDVKDCVMELGSSPLDVDQATTIWTRLDKAYNGIRRIPKSHLIHFGYIWTGISDIVLKNLQLNPEEAADVIASFTSFDRSFTRSQIDELTLKINAWKLPELYSGADLMVVGRFLCWMNATEFVSRLPPSSYLQASAYLGDILSPPCDQQVLTFLAKKAQQTIAFGPSSTWTAAIVRNVGTVIGGLSADELRSIPPSSLFGLTPDAVRSISPNNFLAFKTNQLRNFPLAAAQAITTEQRAVLLKEMSQALDYVIYGKDAVKSSAHCFKNSNQSFERYPKNNNSREHHHDTSTYCNAPFTSTAELQLRFLCPSDLEQVKELCKEWFPIQYPDTWYRDITSDPRFYSLAAIYQSQLVGLLIAEVKNSDAINKEDRGILDTRMYKNCHVGYILSLGVCSSLRRQGVASLLLDSFLNHVTQTENQICKAIYLHVLTMNSAAIRFYEKHYFRLHSFLPYYYSVDGKCKDGFSYVLYINGGHPPWGLLDYLYNWCQSLYDNIYPSYWYNKVKHWLQNHL